MYKFPEIITKYANSAYFDYDYVETEWPDRISVTSLIDAPYIQHMKKEHGKELWYKVNNDIDFGNRFSVKNWWLVFGKSIHDTLEKFANTLNTDRMIKYATEVRKEIAIDIEGEVTYISGKYDLRIRDTSIGKDELIDYKVTSKYILSNEIRLHDYFWQLNILKYIHAPGPTGINKLTLILFLRDLMPQDKYNSQFPDIPVVELDVPIYSDEEVRNYIIKRIIIHRTMHERIKKGLITNCSIDERWGKPETFAVIKEGAKTAYRVFESEIEAMTLAKSKKGYVYEFRPATDTRCTGYCDYNIFCPYYKQNYGDLI